MNITLEDITVILLTALGGLVYFIIHLIKNLILIILVTPVILISLAVMTIIWLVQTSKLCWKKLKKYAIFKLSK